MNFEDPVSVTSNQSSPLSFRASTLKKLGEIVSTNPQIRIINGGFSK